MLLSDAAEYVRHLKDACVQMETTIRLLSGRLRERTRQGPGQQEDSSSPSPTEEPRTSEQSSQQPFFGLAHTRSAIFAAVKEAAALPAEERNKKIRSLRAKWHPDKHDVLQDMASEVMKMINEAVDQYLGDSD